MDGYNEKHPVHADYLGNGEFDSTGLAFEDYTRMSTVRRKLNTNRRYSAPPWAFNDDKVAKIIVSFIESRAAMGKLRKWKRDGSNTERLARAQEELNRRQPDLVSTLDKLTARYMAAMQVMDDEDLAPIGRKVEEVDTQLFTLDKVPQLLAGVVYFYWRMGLDSVETGRQIGLKPPHVRQMLHKLWHIAAALGYDVPKPVSEKYAARRAENALTLEQCDLIVALRKQGRFTVDIVKELGLDKSTGCEIVTRVFKERAA